MTSQDETPLRSPRLSDPEPPQILPRVRNPIRASGTVNRPFSEIDNPFRRSNTSLSAIFNSTSIRNSAKRASTPIIGSRSITPLSESGYGTSSSTKETWVSNPYRDTIIRSLAPRIAVLASQDTEDLLAQKGFPGGFLQLIRPYGENIPGRVTIRDNTGSSKSYEDFAIHFGRIQDGLESPRVAERRNSDTRSHNINGLVDKYFPASSARLRTGGDVGFVEDVLTKHLSNYESEYYEEEQEEDTSSQDGDTDNNVTFTSAFHLLYLRRLLSGLPLSPHETFSHPAACVIATSSRNNDPIESLRQAYNDTYSGDHKLPQWVNNDFLRYYVLVHDEEHDSVSRSQSIFEQMKRHFGIHCHLLRIRSTQCVPSDDDCVELPSCEWLSAAEELADIEKRENEDDIETLGPYLFESDESSVKGFVRELVTQSVIPIMERQCATWNDQIASRRRGLGGRFLSISKKWTFSSRNSPSVGSSGSNYDSLQGFYRPDAPEAILRKLADYAFMLRDFRLAQNTYELIRGDYNNDKAWKYYAGVNEMTAITSLIGFQSLPLKSKNDSLDQVLDTACYSYLTRCDSPFYALRTLAVAVEILAMRGGSGADDAARWATRISELDLIGEIGQALFAERIASCFAMRGNTGSKHSGTRRRKSAMWSVIACEDWAYLEKKRHAQKCLSDAFKMYGISLKDMNTLAFDDMKLYLEELKELVAGTEESTTVFSTMNATTEHFEPQQGLQVTEITGDEKLDIRKHRQSLVGMSTAPVISIDESTEQPGGIIENSKDKIAIPGRGDEVPITSDE